MHHISIFVQALAPKLNASPLWAFISILVTLTMPTLNEHAIVNTSGCHTPAQSSDIHPCQKSTSYKVRVEFSNPIHTVRVRSGPPIPNNDRFIAKPSSHHVHVSLWVTPPTSPCPTISADAEPVHKYSVQYDVSKSALYSLKCFNSWGMVVHSCFWYC